MATYVVGDIQGCYKPLRRLLRSADFHPSRDKLWCVGDLINRGPKSLHTLRFLYDMQDAVTAVLGNHDLHFLALYHGCAPDSVSSRHTLYDLLAAPDCDALAEWLRHRPLAHYDCIVADASITHYLMVHAGVAPQWTLQRTLALAAEVELTLQGPDFRDYLRAMYGNQPDRWNDDLLGQERLRLITNYLTRMRFCSADGRLDLETKEGANQAPKGFFPWFELEQLTPDTRILFGHWAALQGVTDRPYVYALDTGCVWGRELTMMRLEDHKFFSV